MDEDGARLVHALCEVAGFAVLVLVADHETGGHLADALKSLWRKAFGRIRPHLTWVSMLADASLGGGSVTVAEAEEIVHG